MNLKELAGLKKAALVAMAKARRIPRYSRMTKEELARTLAVEPAAQRPKRKRSRIVSRKTEPGAKAESSKTRITEPRPSRKKRKATGPEKKTYLAGRRKKAQGARPRAQQPPHLSVEPKLPDAPVPGRDHTRPAAPPESATRHVPSTPPLDPDDGALRELPSRYEEDRMGLLPRDPRWLFAFWDVSSSSRRAAKRAGTGGFCLRIFDVTGRSPGVLPRQPFLEIDVGNADNWFIESGRPGGTFVAQIGWMDRSRGFRAVAESRPATTPWDSKRPAKGPVRFVRIPLDIPLTDLRKMLLAAGQQGKSLAEALHEMGYAGDVPAGMTMDEFLRAHSAEAEGSPGVSSLDLVGQPTGLPTSGQEA